MTNDINVKSDDCNALGNVLKMIITICLLYSVISLVSILGFLFITFGLHDVIFWGYELIPFCFSLIPVLGPFFHFILAWMKFMWNICEACLYITFHLFSYIVALFSIGIPYLSRPLRVSFSFLKWVCSELWRGICLTGNPILTMFSWVVFTCTCLLCLDQVFNMRNFNILRNNQIAALQANIPAELNEEQYGDEDQQYQNAENRLIEIRRRLVNRQLPNRPANQNREEHPRHNQENLERRETNNENREDNLDTDQYNNTQLCIICIENVRNFAVFPCGHLYFCRQCVENLFRSIRPPKCPVCNISIQEFRRIYR